MYGEGGVAGCSSDTTVDHNGPVLLTISTTTRPATDLGYLLHKHPGRVQTHESSVGVAHVFYPEATDERCTVALLLEVDPIALVRGKRHGSQAFSLAQYVNDRPYAATSMLTVAMNRVFRTAMAGRCEARPELAVTPLELEVRVPSLPSADGGDMIRRMFEPLGWAVSASNAPLDPAVPRWGESRYFDVTLTGQLVLSDALSQLAVLIPCLDGGKHYWVSDDEVDKLLRSGRGWLAGHPERDTILRRSLAHQRDLIVTAAGRLAEVDDSSAALVDDGPPSEEPPPARKALSLQRMEAVLEALGSVNAHRVVDVGCGEGTLLRRLLQDPSYTEVVGADVSARALDVATKRLGLERMPDSQRARLTLLQSSLMYGDLRLRGFDAIVLQEVVEHIEPDRLPSLERNVFAVAEPTSVIVTTPNADYNPLFPSLPVGTMRHHDHRFEWTRSEFAEWATRVAVEHHYTVEVAGVGEIDQLLGAPTQMATFRKLDANRETA